MRKGRTRRGQSVQDDWSLVGDKEAWLRGVRQRLLDGMRVKGWNQRQLARAAGVSDGAVAQWFSSGAPSPKTLRRVAEAFGVDFRALVGYEEAQEVSASPISTWPMVGAGRLHQALKVAGLTNAQLAEEMGVSEGTVKLFRKGSLVPNADQLAWMVRRARTSSDKILGLEPGGALAERVLRNVEAVERAIRQLRDSVRDETPDQAMARVGTAAERALSIATEIRQSVEGGKK